MDEKTCFFIGHRNTPDSIKEELKEVVEKHITEYGVNTFTVGHYGSFDCLVQKVLIEAKQHHADIKVYILAPYALTQKRIMPIGIDGTLYPEGTEKVPRPYAIVYANRYMIKNSDYLIAYCQHPSKTRDFVEYAQRREKKGLIKVTLLKPVSHI